MKKIKIMVTTIDRKEIVLPGYNTVEEAVADLLTNLDWYKFYACTMWGYPAVYAVTK